MKLLCSFSVRGLPVSEGSKRAFLPKGSDQPVVVSVNARNLAAWRAQVAAAAATAYRAQPVDECPVYLWLSFFFARPRSHSKARRFDPWVRSAPDIEKLVRAVNDALQHVLYRNDAQVAVLTATKSYAVDGHLPGLEAKVFRLTAADR